MAQKLIDELNNKYGLLTPIALTKDKNNRTAWLCKCDCGNTKIVRGSDLRKGKITSCGKQCPLRYTRNGVFVDETGNKYGLLTVMYRVNFDHKTKIKWHCKCECGNECDVSGADLRSGNQISCGCLRSKGEREINTILLEKNIQFKKEYSFDDLRGINNGKLRFDFAIFNNNILKGLIEFQGEQHFYPVKAFGGIETFKERTYNDQKKLDYCENNNIPLLLLRKTDNIKEKINQFIGENFNE